MGYFFQIAGDSSSVTEGIDLAKSLIEHGEIPIFRFALVIKYLG